jgi:cell division protease FtsH
MTFGKKEEQVFLGREISKSQDYSEQTAEAIDLEVKSIVIRNYDKAKHILSDKIEILHALASALVQREVLDGNEVDMIVGGKTLADVDEDRRKRAETLKAEVSPNEKAEEEKVTVGDMVTKPVRA